METYEQKKRRLYGKQLLTSCLNEFNKIIKVNIYATSLLSIVETDLIRNQIPTMKIKYKYEILFSEKDKLKEIIFNNVENYNSSYYVFASYTENCGLLVINSLQDFNLDFSFKDVASGIITLVRCDLLEEIVFDFYEEDGMEYLEIEFLMLVK